MATPSALCGDRTGGVRVQNRARYWRWWTGGSWPAVAGSVLASLQSAGRSHAASPARRRVRGCPRRLGLLAARAALLPAGQSAGSVRRAVAPALGSGLMVRGRQAPTGPPPGARGSPSKWCTRRVPASTPSSSAPSRENRAQLSNATRSPFAPCSRYASATSARTTGSTSARMPSGPRSNSPFRPFVLTSTSIGQEGLDFHPWCHRLVHWNLPGNPVDLEQREGRIHRYKGHAVRRNVAASHADEAFASWRAGDDIWMLGAHLSPPSRGPRNRGRA